MTLSLTTLLVLIIAFGAEVGWLLAKVQLRGAGYKLLIWTSPKGCPAPHPPRQQYPRHWPVGKGR